MNAAHAMRQVVEETRRERVPLPSPPVRRAIRVASGATQSAVAGAIEVTRASIARYELGTREPRGAIRRRYAEALDELRRV
jgi:predicted transcriptional regulator